VRRAAKKWRRHEIGVAVGIGGGRGDQLAPGGAGARAAWGG